MRWLKALFGEVFGWVTVHDTGIWRYQRHVDTGARRIVPGAEAGYGWQPKDEGWIKTGEWSEPRAPSLVASLITTPHFQAIPTWSPMAAAKKDRTTIWALLRPDIYPVLRPGREDLEPWNGLQVPIRHPGLTADGHDFGWNIAAPVGSGGFPDEWFVGWRPLAPVPPTAEA